MTGVTTADQVVREDLSDLYINVDERKTIIQTLKRGDNLENVLQWGNRRRRSNDRRFQQGCR